MKNNSKKLLGLLMSLMMLIGCTGTVYAAELPKEDTRQVVDQQRSVTKIYEYKNDKFNSSAVRYFTASAGGKVSLLLGASPLSGTDNANVTMRLYVKNVLDTYAEIASITVKPNGTASIQQSSENLYAGDDCMLTITTTSNKNMAVVANVIVNN